MDQDFSPPAFEFASLWQRLAAHFIDVVIMIAILLVFMFLGAGVSSFSSDLDRVIPRVGLAAMVGYRLLGDALMGGRAIGKRRMRIRVVDAASRNACAFWQGALRNVLLFIPFLNLLHLHILLEAKQERLGDRLARTYVVRDELSAPLPQKSLY